MQIFKAHWQQSQTLYKPVHFYCLKYKLFLQIQEMMTTIKKTFRDETSRYEWIDDQTRQKINEKV